MDKVIKWNSHVEFEENKIKEKRRQLESKWQVKFPRLYIEIVTSNDSAMPFIKDKCDN